MTAQAYAKSVDAKINALMPGQNIRISGDDNCWVEVERSGDGIWLRWVRFTPNSSEIFKTEKF